MKNIKKGNQNKPSSVAEPLFAYEVNTRSNNIGTTPSSRERIMKNTTSVDEYFDKLLSLVHQDYENL